MIIVERIDDLETDVNNCEKKVPGTRCMQYSAQYWFLFRLSTQLVTNIEYYCAKVNVKPLFLATVTRNAHRKQGIVLFSETTCIACALMPKNAASRRT